MYIDNHINIESIPNASVVKPSANDFRLFVSVDNNSLTQIDNAGDVINLTDTNVPSIFNTRLAWDYIYFCIYYAGQSAGFGYGASWTPTGTATTEFPFIGGNNSLLKTVYTSAATTLNQQVGIIGNGNRFGRGSAAAAVAGFYFKCRFFIEGITNAQTRIFVGLASGAVVTNDNPAGNHVGLYHNTVDDINTLSWMTKNGTTLTKNNAFTISGGLAVHQCYEVEITCANFSSSINCILRDYTTGNVISNVNVSATLPLTTATLTPVAHMSNANNTAVGAVAIGVNVLYCRTAT